MSETPQSTPPEAPQASQSSRATPAISVVPWYRRPLFWGLLLFLGLLLLAAWLFWKEWQAAEAARADIAARTAQLRERNVALETFAAQLRALLTKNPCEIRQGLSLLTPPAGVPWPPLGAGAPGAPDTGTSGGEAAAPLPVQNPAAAPSSAGQNPAAQQPAAVSALMEQGTVLVLARRPEGLSMGSGFFVAPGYVATNAHVVGSAAEAVVINKATGGALAARTLRATEQNGQDFALLRVNGGAGITPLTFAASVNRTEKVSAWGFPGAVTGDDPKFAALLKGDAAAAPEVVYTEGVVSVVLDRKPPLIVHTATVSQGNSGGPLVNERGEVVGINTFIKLDGESYRQSSIAIVGTDLAAFLRACGVPFTMAGNSSAGGKP
jgi:S1-C subfamily serine protease